MSKTENQKEEVKMNEAAKQVAAALENIAIANAKKEEREAASGRKDPNSPLGLGRLAYEVIWQQQKQPWAWDHLRPLGDVPKGYVNPIPWIGVVKPADWNKQEQAVDEHGKPMFDKNGEKVMTWANKLRIRHLNPVFMASRRLQMHKDAVLVAAEPKYLVLWAINIDGERWLEAEDLMAEDSYWWKIYQKEFGFFGEEDTEAIGITSHDGTGNRSGNEVTHVEA